MPFLGDVVLRACSPTTFSLDEPVFYRGKCEYFCVPRGFVTDLASVPWWLVWLVPRYGRYTMAALLHDHLCVEAQAGRFSRHDADSIFRRCLRELGVGLLQRCAMFAAARAASRWSDATRGEALMLTLVTLAAVLILLVPCLAVLVWGYGLRFLNWLVDKCSNRCVQVLGRRAPKSQT